MERCVPQTPWWHISAIRKRQIERKMEIGPNQSDLRPKQNILAIPKNKGREGNDGLYWFLYHLHGQTGRFTASAKFRTGKFHSVIAFTICTNQFLLLINHRESLKLKSKMGLNKWNTTGKTGLPFQIFRCSRKCSIRTTQKAMFPLLSHRISRKPFC